MKGIKKLAAIAAGAALVGMALAPVVSAIDLQKSNVIGSDGSPLVDIVVGSKADISDVVWAGNIAAKLAQKSVKSGAVTCTKTGSCAGDATPSIEGLAVDLTVGGTTTYTGAKTYKNVDMNSATGTTKEVSIANSTQNGWLTDSQLSHLYNKSTTYKYAGTSYTITMKEYIGVDADVRFDYARPDVKDLVLYMDSDNDFNYTIDLGTGIPMYDGNLASGVKFEDGTDDNIKIPLFGTEYLVSEINPTGANVYVKLIALKGKETFNVGEAITGLTGKNDYAGQAMTAKFAALSQTGSTSTYQATFELYDDAGAKVDTQTVSANTYLNTTFVDGDGDYALSTDILVNTIAGIVNADGSISGYVEIYKGTDVIELYDLKGYPYDSSNTTDVHDWKVTMEYSTTDSNKLTSIAIGNSYVEWDKDNPIFAKTGTLTQAGKDGLKEAVFLEGYEDIAGYNYASVAFDGLEQDESTTKIKIGDNKIEYYDAGDSFHSIPFYIQVSGDTTSSFTFDSKTIYYKCDATDVDVNIHSDIVGTMTKLNGIDQNVFLEGAADAFVSTALFDSYLNVTVRPQTGDRVDLNGVNYLVQDYNSNPDTNAYVTLRADGNCQFATSAIASATDADYIDTANVNNTFYYSDRNTSVGPFWANPVTLEGANSQTYEYAMWVSEATYGELWLLLDYTTNFSVQYNADINFFGTDTDLAYQRVTGPAVAAEFTPTSLAAAPVPEDIHQDETYYVPDIAQLGGTSSGSTYYTAIFSVEGDAINATRSGDAHIYIDTGTDELIDASNSNLSMYGSDLNYNPYFDGTDPTTGNGEGEAWSLRRDDQSIYMSKGYSDFGTLYEISTTSPYIATITKPQNILYPIIVVKGTSTTSTVEGGEAFTGIAKGENVKTAGGTTITIDDITYASAYCGDTGESTVTCAPSAGTADLIVPVNTLVYTDSMAVAGAHIIVGGWKVNSLASNITLADGSTLQDQLTSSGDYVAEVLSTGDLIVAGWTARDTGTAAQALIDALDTI